MKKKIWIEVDKLRLSELKKSRIIGSKDNEKYAWGNLGIGTQGFVLNSLLITLREESNLSQNNAQCNMRFLDVPLKHRLKNKGRAPRRRMLEDVIALAVADEYLRRRKEELLPVFNNNEDSFSFPWFTPPEWQGSLRIPVEFIRLFSFECHENGSAYAHIQVGHHLVFWNVCIFGIFDQHHRPPFNRIRDQKILLAINQLLAKKEVRAYLENLIIQRRAIPDETEFIDAFPDCQPDGLPPRIRFY